MLNMSNRDLLSFPLLSSEDLSVFLTEQNIDHSISGPVNTFQGVAQVGRCEAHHLIWSKAMNDAVLNTPARVILLPKSTLSEYPKKCNDKTFLFVDNPREAFRTILARLFSKQYDIARGFYDPDIFKEVEHGVKIALSANIAQGTKMGRDVVIHPSVTVYPNVTLGDNVEISAGCIIGAPGFGHVRQKDGTLEHFPHIGGVIIGDNVTIGSNTCVDSGGLSPTIISTGCKIGNLTQIAHNVELDENCLIGTRCQIAGGTKIGQRTEVWAGVTISNNRVIGKDCSIKIGSVVISNLADGAEVSGNFAVRHDMRMRQFKNDKEE